MYAEINIPSFCSTILLGLFSDVLNYVLRISKDSPLTPVSSDTDSDQGVAGEEEVKVKQRSFIRQKKTVVCRDDDDRTDVGMVCVECFKFLKALAKDYSEVQERY